MVREVLVLAIALSVLQILRTHLPPPAAALRPAVPAPLALVEALAAVD